MKRLFLVVAKLLGFLQLYWTLSRFIFEYGSFIMAIGQHREYMSAKDVGQALPLIIAATADFFMQLVMAWLLLARTEWLAHKFRIPEDGDIEALDKSSTLLVGSQLIGIYVIVQALPALVKAIVTSRSLWASDTDRFPGDWIAICPWIIQLSLGLILALWSEKVVAVITRKAKLVLPPAAE